MTERRSGVERRDAARPDPGRRLFDRIRAIDPTFEIRPPTAAERDEILANLRADLAARGVTA